MLAKYFQCVLNYTRTGDEQPLKAAVNTDFADAYIPRIAAKRRTSHALKERLEPLERGTVPAWCNFITTAVDVQSNRFECMTMGWTAGMRSVIIDRFTISTSNRDETADRKAALDPASFVEDWEVLDAECCEREYVIEGTESTIKPVVTVCDSGGKDGVTIRAYEFWRKMRARNKGNRFQLVKGDTKLGAPRVVQSYPDVRNRKSRQSGARGDVPVWLLNVNVLKDGCSIDLARTEPGPGFVHLPDWVTVEMLEEWTAETRNEKGIWETVRQNVRNETGDLHVYNRAACILLQAERVNWERPPDWATVLGTRFAKANSATPTQINVADIARMLNG
jgi:phage terminase large subunit GpA-like protein